MLEYASFKNQCIGTKYKFMFLPKICHISGNLLWLKKCYVQTALYTGPGDPIFENRYYDKKEFLLARIQGIV